MFTVTVIGSGNVAQHLVAAFSNSDAIALHEVYSRKSPSFTIPPQVKWIDSLADLSKADLYIIAVSDAAVSTVSNQLPFTDRLVTHTSGSLPYTAVDPKNRRGVFYPLQTFSKNKHVNFGSIPMCLEAEFAADYGILENVAKSVSDSIYKIDSQQRKALHVAAVFVNNFANHLYSQAYDICTENGVPFDILKPLIRETADKVMSLKPDEAQTGPAIRYDQATIEAHLIFLTDHNQSDIYKLLTQSIQNHGKKL